MTLNEQLASARQAYHALQTGTMARVVVDQNGERVEFVAANKANLYSYIQQLAAQCPAECSPIPNNGPVGFVF